jgi:fructokinase
VLGVGARRIFLGGGVLTGQPQLFVQIRASLQDSLNGYLNAVEVGPAIDDFIVPPALGAAVGPLGALAVAADQLCPT